MIYQQTAMQFAKVLRNLSTILEKGVGYAETKKFDFEVLLNARLTPDQFNLTRQIQIACDTAKFFAARVSGKEAPTHEDNEKTFADLKTRLESVATYLEKFTEKDFANAATQKVTQARWEGKWLTGEEYLNHHALPNFYFHVTTAYSILRNNGVEIGKKDYLGTMPFRH